MKRLSSALCALYVIAAAVMLRCATVSYSRGDGGWAATFAAAAVLFALAFASDVHHRGELLDAWIRLERASRPANQTPAIDGAVAVAMAGWCCDTWFWSKGHDHDPATCTRKDSAA